MSLASGIPSTTQLALVITRANSRAQRKGLAEGSPTGAGGIAHCDCIGTPIENDARPAWGAGCNVVPTGDNTGIDKAGEVLIWKFGSCTIPDFPASRKSGMPLRFASGPETATIA
mmetsp:Transcript_49467/g.115686  ORF Transcript_49467/g.115686 Transcript_49467/m.115686 type:complete len:115 (-) Transcript_49467:781-1125(-)